MNEETKKNLKYQFFLSIVKQDFDLFKLLVDLGAEKDDETYNGLPLFNAALLNNDDGWRMVDYLLECGVDVNAKNKKGNTALYELYDGEYWGSGYGLIQRGADVNIKNRGGKTILHLMVEECNPQRVRFLMKAGANPLIKNRKGDTPIILAKKLLDKEEDLEKKNKYKKILEIFYTYDVFP